jgi:hypothetical protein
MGTWMVIMGYRDNFASPMFCQRGAGMDACKERVLMSRGQVADKILQYLILELSNILLPKVK